jgi:hypothetical protein
VTFQGFERAVVAPAVEDRTRQLLYVAAYLILGALTLSPLLSASVPSLIDYPNHLARMSLLAESGKAAAAAQNYVTHWRLLPNLAMDLAVPLLSQIMPVEQAGRLFIATTMTLLVVSTVALRRVLYGRVGLWPLCSLLFVYNFVLWWGFLNYLFGLGIALLAFSAWIASKNWKIGARVSVFSVIAVILLVLHLFAFGVYGLLVVSYEAGNWLDARPRSIRGLLRRMTSLAQFVPAVLVWFVSSSNGGKAYWAFGTILHRFVLLISPIAFSNPPSAFDRALLVMVLFTLYVGLRTQTLRISPVMRLPLAAMIVVAVLMPEWASGSWAADIRLPVAFPFVFIAATRLDISRRWPIALFAAIGMIFLGIRVWAVSQSWADMDARFSELRAASGSISEGARVLVVQSTMPPEVQEFKGLSPLLQTRGFEAFIHMPALVVLDRGAFVPNLFSGWAPVEPTPRNAGMSRILEGPLNPDELVSRIDPLPPGEHQIPNVLGELPCCFDWPRIYDFVVWIDFGKLPLALPAHLEPVASGSFFHIYRVQKP